MNTSDLDNLLQKLIEKVQELERRIEALETQEPIEDDE